MQCHNGVGKDSLKVSMSPNCYNRLMKCCAKSSVASQAEVSNRHGGWECAESRLQETQTAEGAEVIQSASSVGSCLLPKGHRGAGDPEKGAQLSLAVQMQCDLQGQDAPYMSFAVWCV